MNDDKILAVDVLKNDKIANNIKPPVTDLAIESVSAHNLKEIVVNFNQQVNKDKLGSFTVDNKVKIADKVLSEDGKKLTLTVEGTLKKGKEYTVTVKDTEAVAEGVEKLAEVSEKVTPVDTTIPEVTSVEFSGPKLITVTFSEPMMEGKLSALKDAYIVVAPAKGSLSIKKTESEVKGNKAFIHLYGTIEAEKEYTVTIDKFADPSGLINKYYSEKLTVTKDTENPTILNVTANETSYTVEFSEPVMGIKKDDFHHTYNGIKAKAIYFVPNKVDPATKKSVEVKDTDVVTKVKVVFYQKDGDTPLGNGDVKVLIDGGRIMDSWKNKLDDYKGSVNVESDLEKPEVKAVEAGDTYIKVTFTEEVKHRISKSNSFSVTNKDGKEVFQDVNYDENIAKVTLKNVKANDVVKITIKNMVDLSVNENRMDGSHVEDVTLLDKKGPKVEKATHYKKDDVRKLFIVFDEELDSATALNIKNYKLVATGNKVTDLSKTPEFFEGNANVIVISLTEDEYTLAATTSTRLFVQNVADLKNNTMNSDATIQIMNHTDAAGQKIALVEDAKKPVRAIDRNTIVVKFNQTLAEVDASKFSFDGGVEIADLNWEGDTVTIKTAADLPDSLATVKLDIAAKSVKGIFTVSESDFAAVTDKDVLDGVAPFIKKADDKYVIAQSTTTKNQIVLTANENIKAIASATDAQMSNDIKVYYNDVELTLADAAISFENPGGAKHIKINILKVVKDDKLVEYNNAAVNQEGTVKVVIKDAKYITDAAGNAIEDCTASVKLDLKKPEVVGVKTTQVKTDDNLVEVTFSEPLGNAALTVDWFKLATNAPASATYKGEDKKVVVLKYTDTNYANGNLVITVNVVDAFNNALTETTYTLSNKGAITDGANVWTLQP